MMERARFPNGVSIVLRDATKAEGGGYAIEVLRKGKMLRRKFDGIEDRARRTYREWADNERAALERRGGR